MDLSKNVGNLATSVSVDASIEALITFMCDVLRDTEEYRKILEDEYQDCKLELEKKTSSISYEDYQRIKKLCDKFEKQLSKFSKAFTEDYLDILTVGLTLSNLRVKHGSAMKEYDRFELEDKEFNKKATNLARKIERIIKEHDKLAVVYNTQIDKLDTFHKHLEKQLIIYTTNYDRKFVIPVKDYIAEFRSVKSDDTYKKKGQIISDHLKDMLKRMNKNGDGSPFIRISKLEDVNFDSDDKDKRKRKSDDSGIDGVKRRNATASDKPSSNEPGIPRTNARDQYDDQLNVQRSSSDPQIGSLQKDGSSHDSPPNLQRVSPNAFEFESSQDAGSQDDTLSSEEPSSNASEEIMEHSDVSEPEPASLASGSEETGETGMINSQQNMESPETDGEEMDNDEASEIDRPVEHLRNEELTTDLDPDDKSSPENFSSMDSSELGNKFGASESKKVRFDLDDKKRLQRKIDQIRKKRKINPEHSQIPTPQVYDMFDKNLIASKQTIFGKLLELERQKKIKEELLSHQDGNEDSGEDVLQNSASISERNIAPTRRIESDVTAADSEGLQSEDKGSSGSDGSSDSANDLVRLARKRHLEKNKDPYYDVLENFAPISKRRMVPRRRIKPGVTASDSESSDDSDSENSDSDSESSDSD